LQFLIELCNIVVLVPQQSRREENEMMYIAPQLAQGLARPRSLTGWLIAAGLVVLGAAAVAAYVLTHPSG
jgi:hypothetical protein